MMTGLGLGMDGILYQMDENAPSLLGLGEEDVSDIMLQLVESVEKITHSAPNAL